MRNILAILGLCSMLMVQSCDTSLRPENKVSVDKVNPGERETSNINQSDIVEEPVTGAVNTAEMAYICPMRCEGSASKTPGNCPVCKMELVKNPNYKEDPRHNTVLNHEPAPGEQPTVDDRIENQPR